MGGERFDTPQPEAYLFGENADLNFLGSRPTPVSTTSITQFNYILKLILIFQQINFSLKYCLSSLLFVFSFLIHHLKPMSQQRHWRVWWISGRSPWGLSAAQSPSGRFQSFSLKETAPPRAPSSTLNLHLIVIHAVQLLFITSVLKNSHRMVLC